MRSYSKRATLPYKQSSSVPCGVDVIILSGVECAVYRLVASKMSRAFFANAMSMCCGVVKAWGKYRKIQTDSGMLYRLRCSLEMVFMTSTMCLVIDE